MSKKVISFAPGPASLPMQVKEEIKEELLDYQGMGISVMEISHRSPQFSKILQEAEQDLRDLMGIPSNYKVIFLQGGGTGQFAAIPLNIGGMRSKDGPAADYLVTGAWSAKAAKEAEKFCKVRRVLPDTKKYVTIPEPELWQLTSDADYVYFCSNETIHGVEFHFTPAVSTEVPLVCDMSSNILTQPIDVSRYGIIYAGAQKNIGIAALAVVVVREDLIGHAAPFCPSILDYKVNVDNKSLYNTPPVFSIYVLGKVLKWIKKQGGVEEMARRCDIKSSLIYDVIDGSNEFYCSPVAKSARSRVTIPLRILKDNEDLEARFVKEAAEQGMISLKGHRSVGGIRVSLFNAISIEDTEKLVAFMKKFQKDNQPF